MADRKPTTTAPRTGSSALTPKETRAGAKVAARESRAAVRSRRKNATDPADMGRFRQIAQAYKVTHEFDPRLPLVLAGAFLLPVVLGVVIGLLVGHVVYAVVMGLLIGLLLAMALLVRRAKQATFKRYAGQTGSAEVALSMLPKQWISTPVIAATRQRDVVHRTLGPGGVVLVGEGDTARVRQLLGSEARKHERVAYGVTVTALVMGDAPNQVPLNKLTDKIRKLPKVLEANQVTDLKARLRALDAVRPVVAMPKGPMPTRGARQATRGR
ncbi:MAG: DUF4191 domain-containing protein [Janthinobacterium lividum]